MIAGDNQQSDRARPLEKTVSFETRATEALETWLVDQNSRNTIFNLKAALGLLAVVLPELRQGCGDDRETVIQQTLCAMLYRYDSSAGRAWIAESVIVEGFLQHDRWCSLLDDEDAARAFIVMVCRHLDMSRRLSPGKDMGDVSREEMVQRRTVTTALRVALTGWLGAPDKKFVSIRGIAQTLFGDAWCTVVADGNPDDVSIADTIERSQPPFVDGWLTTACQNTPCNLPDLDLN
jgi:hypothetical protein